MDDDKKKIIMISIIITCLGLAIAITYWTNYDSSFSYTVPLLCSSPQCGEKTELNAKQLRDEMMKANKDSSTNSGPLAFVCSHCGKKTCYIAEKCVKCGFLFIPKYDAKTREYINKCPKCGYDFTEEKKEGVIIP